MTRAKKGRPADRDALKRALVRAGLTYEAAAFAFCLWADYKHALSGQYLGKIACGWTPSPQLGRALVRWLRQRYGERVRLLDLGLGR